MKLKADITPDAKLKVKAIKDKKVRVEVSIDDNNTRKKQVETCERCGGDPEITDITLEGFTGTRCAHPKCMLVIEWDKAGTHKKLI